MNRGQMSENREQEKADREQRFGLVIEKRFAVVCHLSSDL